MCLGGDWFKLKPKGMLRICSAVAPKVVPLVSLCNQRGSLAKKDTLFGHTCSLDTSEDIMYMGMYVHQRKVFKGRKQIGIWGRPHKPQATNPYTSHLQANPRQAAKGQQPFDRCTVRKTQPTLSARVNIGLEGHGQIIESPSCEKCCEFP